MWRFLSSLFFTSPPPPFFFFHHIKQQKLLQKKKKNFFFNASIICISEELKTKGVHYPRHWKKKIKHETHYINLGFINSVFFFFPFEKQKYVSIIHQRTVSILNIFLHLVCVLYQWIINKATGRLIQVIPIAMVIIYIKLKSIVLVL